MRSAARLPSVRQRTIFGRSARHGEDLADAGAISWAAGSGYLMIADHNSGNHALFKVANTVVQRLD